MKRIYMVLLILLAYSSIIFSQNFEKDGTKIRICVNPGHGGFDSDDRNQVIYPFKQNDPEGFWESQSNLDKGLYLRDLLEKSNAEVVMTRTTNTTNDDLDLSVIVEMANANNCDYMLSIHSNAGVNNYILMLCSGKDPDDTHIYSDVITAENEKISREVGQIVADNLYSNQVSNWVGKPRVSGDKTFARTVMGWSNGYGVLRWLKVPGMISEGAMHDYTPETYRLMNMDYKHMEAWHFYKSFCRYFETGEQKIGKVAGWVKDKWANFNESFPSSYNYFFQVGTSDEYLPVNAVKVTLLSTDEQTVVKQYMTDNMYNGYFMLDSITPGKYKLKMEREHYQTKIQEVEVKANAITYANTYLDKDRTEPLVVKSFAPDSSLDTPVAAATHIRFLFNFEIDTLSFETGFHIDPSVEGTFRYSQYQRVATFVPNKPLAVNTVYTVKLDKSVKHIGNWSLENDFIFQFKTKAKNDFNLLAYSPNQGDLELFPETMIKFVFDSKLDKTVNINNYFSLLKKEDKTEVLGVNYEVNTIPGKLGSYSFKVSLEPETEYLLRMDEGLRNEDSIKIGKPLEYSFKTGKKEILVSGQKEDFEDTKLFVVDKANSVHLDENNTNINRLTGTSVSGKRSYRLSYVFMDKGGAVATTYQKQSIEVHNGDGLGIYVWGDLSSNDLYAVVSDGSEEKEFLLSKMDYTGWAFKEIQIERLAEGKEYYFSGFRLVSADTPYSYGGDIMFDNLLVNNTPLAVDASDVFNELLIYPNPAVDYIHLKGIYSDESASYIIYSLSGTEVMSGKLAGNTVDITSLDNGSYLIRICTDKASFSMPILISH